MIAKRCFIVIVILSFLFISAGFAEAYTIDGFLDDWEVDPSTPGSEDWVPNPGIYYTEEDTTTDFVGPGWGGQKYDAEAIYLDWDDTNLYVALVTGFPDTGIYEADGDYYVSAGDIGIDFGINGTYEYGIEIGGHYPGEYWGYDGTPGHVYKDISWDTSPTYPESDPLNIADTGSPTDVGSGSFIYANSYPNIDPLYDHWVVEASVSKSAFGADWDHAVRVHWTQTCGNDIATVASPEPSSMALLGLGLFGLLGARFRRRR